MRFVDKARSSEGLRAELAALSDTASLAPLVQLAVQHGFSFSEADLRAAFTADWSMRAVLLARRGGDGGDGGGPDAAT